MRYKRCVLTFNQLAAFKRSEFAIINTDNPDDLPIEHHTPVTDNSDIKMNLQLYYVYVSTFPAHRP